MDERLYLNVPAPELDQLLNSAKFPDHPDVMASITALEASQDVGDHFGRCLSGWIVPKESAEYVFYICSDDASRLSISSDESPANIAQIAKSSGFTIKPRSWETLDPESISAPIHLEAGKRYFVEVLHLGGGGGEAPRTRALGYNRFAVKNKIAEEGSGAPWTKRHQLEVGQGNSGARE